MIRHRFIASPKVSKFAPALGLIVALVGLGAGRAPAAPQHAAPLVTNSDIWMPSPSAARLRPSFMVFEASRNALWTSNAGNGLENGTVSRRDAGSGDVISSITVGKNPTSLALDEARGTLWVVNAGDATLYGINTESGTIVAKIATEKGAQIAAVDSKNGVVFVANCEAGTVTILDPVSMQLSVVRVGRKPLGVAVDATRRRVYIANYGQSSVTVLDADSHQVTGTIAVAPKPITLAVDETSGALFVTHSEAGTVGLVPDARHGETRITQTGGYPLGLNIDGRRGRVYVTDYDNQKLRILDINGNALDNCDVAPSPTGLAFNAQTGRVFVCSEANNQLDVLDLQNTLRPAADPSLNDQLISGSSGALQTVLVEQTEPNYENEFSPTASTQTASLEPTNRNNGGDNFESLPIAKVIEDNSVQRFSQAPFLGQIPVMNESFSSEWNGSDNNGGDNGNPNYENASPFQPSRRPSRVRRFRRPQVEEPAYRFEEVPVGGLGQRIALEAQKLQRSGAAASYHHRCDQLADTTIRRATRYFNHIVGPNPDDTAAKTMRRFQNAGIGTSYVPGLKLRAGDILYSRALSSRRSGHVMIVGLNGKILDQYGAKSRPTTRPDWVVRPDDAIALTAR